MLSKKIAIFILSILCVSVFGSMVFVQYRIKEIEQDRFYGPSRAIYDPELLSLLYAKVHLDSYLDVVGNPLTGPIYNRFFDSDISSKEPIPEFPTPYSRFVFLLRGYQIQGKVHYESPWLNEDLLPKEFIQKSLTRQLGEYVHESRYNCTSFTKTSGDTLFFRACVTDYDRRDSVMKPLIETAFGYSYWKSYFFPETTVKPTVNSTVDHYLLVLHHGKEIYRNVTFDTASAYLLFDPPDKDFRVRIYTRVQPDVTKIGQDVKHYRNLEWELFAIFVLGLIMLLRGDSLRDMVLRWWNKSKKG